MSVLQLTSKFCIYLFRVALEICICKYIYIYTYMYYDRVDGLMQDAKDPETLANLIVCSLHLGKPASRFLR